MQASAMAKTIKPISDRQKVFAEEYPKDLNASKAAKRAGYAKVSSRQTGSLLLKNPEVQAEIQKNLNERSERTKIDADYVLYTIRDTIERCKQAEPVLDDKGQETGEYKFDANAVLKGADLLGKHLKLWTDGPKVDVTVNLSNLSDEQIDQRIKELESKLK